jgi:hypothetical protein
MDGAAPLCPRAPDVEPSPFAEAADLLDVFRRLVPADLCGAAPAGHVGIFTPWVVTWLMVWQRCQGNASLAEAVAEVILGATAAALPDCKRVRDGDISPNTGAYSQARSRLPSEAAAAVADAVFASLVADLPPAWRGRPAYLIDGTSLTLAHRDELLERFPPAVNQHGASHWPVVRLVVAHELSTGISPRWEWGPMYGPEAVSETELAGRQLSRLPAGSTLIYDRNFGIFAMSYMAVEAGHHIVARMTEKRFRAVTRGMEQTAPGEWRGEWRASAADRRGHPWLPAGAVVRGRFVEVHTAGPGGAGVVLYVFTTEMEATHEELAGLYRRRWDIESDIKDVKITLNMDILSGQTVEMVEKEMMLGSVAYNLTVQVRRLAAERAGVRPRELSFSRTLALLKAFARAAVEEDPRRRGERLERLLKAVARCRLPHRPGRSAPREVIPRRRKYPERRRAAVVDKKSK